VPAGGVHEELERVEGARGRGRRGAGLRSGLLGAHDDVALLERGAQSGDLVVGQLVLVRERDELLLLDVAALGGLLEQALGRRQVMQMNRGVQLNPFRSWWGRGRRGLLGDRCAGSTPRMPVSLSEL
jgi:hypothetical protein